MSDVRLREMERASAVLFEKVQWVEGRETPVKVDIGTLGSFYFYFLRMAGTSCLLGQV